MRAHISGISTYYPEDLLTNEALSQREGMPDADEIYRQTGIKQRHKAKQGLIGSDCGLAAARLLMSSTDRDLRSQVDYLIFCTQYTDHVAPTTAARLSRDLQIQQSCGTMDMPMGCVGFINGLGLAKGLIESGQAHSVLFITAETPTHVIHPDDHHLQVLFGDAGAATLIEATDDQDVDVLGKFIYGTNGDGYEQMIVRHSGAREPLTYAWLDQYKAIGGLVYGRMHMNGMRIFTFAMRTVPKLVQEMLDKEDLKMEDIDLFVFHQANGFLLEALRKKLNIPHERFVFALEHCGNTVSASIPIALKQVRDDGRWVPGMTVMLVGFGVGFSWGATVIRST